MKPGELVGAGYRCRVFEWGGDRVIKIFEPDADRAWVENEARVSRLVHAAGLPCPEVGDIAEVDGRLAIVYERIRGQVLSREVMSKPWKAAELASEMAEMHVEMHSKTIFGLPSQRVAMEKDIQSAETLKPEVKGSILAALKRLPDGHSVCHGDLNLDNVILSASGMVAIDWDNAKRGNPMADVARSVLLLNTAKEHFRPSMKDVVASLAAEFRDAYLKRYLEIAGESADAVEDWMLPLAAARLKENVSMEDQALFEIIRERLEVERKS